MRAAGLFGAIALAVAALTVRPGRPPQVVAIHPGADVVPSNLLRFYVDFSEPMAGGDVFDHLELAGDPLAFRTVELWSRERTRLMVYLHPARVKSEIWPEPVLVEGRAYTIVLRAGLRSAKGRPIARDASWTFTAGPADREMPDLDRWTVRGTEIEADEWIDRAGMEEWVRVDGAGPLRIEGRRMTFSSAGRRLEVDPRLEDYAGNSFLRPFETRGTPPPGRATVRVLR